MTRTLTSMAAQNMMRLQAVGKLYVVEAVRQCAALGNTAGSALIKVSWALRTFLSCDLHEINNFV